MRSKKRIEGLKGQHALEGRLEGRTRFESFMDPLLKRVASERTPRYLGNVTGVNEPFGLEGSRHY